MVGTMPSTRPSSAGRRRSSRYPGPISFRCSTRPWAVPTRCGRQIRPSRPNAGAVCRCWMFDTSKPPSSLPKPLGNSAESPGSLPSPQAQE